MSDMSVEEAYRVLQAACGIEVGDKVKVRRMPTGINEMGWDPATFGLDNPDRLRMVGRAAMVKDIHERLGISVLYEYKDGGDRWPFFCLELVEKAKPEPPPIYIGDMSVKFTDGGIKVCDISVSKDKLQEILNRIEGQN